MRTLLLLSLLVAVTATLCVVQSASSQYDPNTANLVYAYNSSGAIAYAVYPDGTVAYWKIGSDGSKTLSYTANGSVLTYYDANGNVLNGASSSTGPAAGAASSTAPQQGGSETGATASSTAVNGGETSTGGGSATSSTGNSGVVSSSSGPDQGGFEQPCSVVAFEILTMTGETTNENPQTAEFAYSPSFSPDTLSYTYVPWSPVPPSAQFTVRATVTAGSQVWIGLNDLPYYAFNEASNATTEEGQEVQSGTFTVPLPTDGCARIRIKVTNDGVCTDRVYTIGCQEQGGQEQSSTGLQTPVSSTGIEVPASSTGGAPDSSSSGPEQGGSETGQAASSTAVSGGDTSSTGSAPTSSTGASVVSSTGGGVQSSTGSSGPKSSTGSSAVSSSSGPDQGGFEEVDRQCSLDSFVFGSEGLSYFPTFKWDQRTYYCSCQSSVFLSAITAVAYAPTTSAIRYSLNGADAITALSGVETATIQYAYGTNKLLVTVSGTGNNKCSTVYSFRCDRFPDSGASNETDPNTNKLYNWRFSAFGTCSGQCTSVNQSTAPGSFERSVQCVDESGATVSDSFCTTARPTVAATCNNICNTNNLDVHDHDDDHDDDDLDISIKSAAVMNANTNFVLSAIGAAMAAWMAGSRI